MFLFNILLNVADWIKSAKKPLDKQLIYMGQQADNLAKLRQEFLSVPELIAKIFCAVGRLKKRYKKGRHGFTVPSVNISLF